MSGAGPRRAAPRRGRYAAAVLMLVLLSACGRVENTPAPDVALESPGRDPLAGDAAGLDGPQQLEEDHDAAQGPERAHLDLQGAPTDGPRAQEGPTGQAPATPEGPAAEPGTVSAPSARQAAGKGVTDDEIFIGFQVTRQLQEAFGAVGAEGDPPSERAAVEAVVAWANSTGGIAGRQIVPVIHETDITTGTFAAHAQAACATFTEDNEVLAVGSSPVAGADQLVSCLAAKQTPLVEQNHWWFDAPAWQQYRGWLYQPAKQRPERGAALWIDALASVGYFRDATVGLVRFDAPVFTRIADNVVKPRLAHHGVELAAEEPVRTPGSLSELGAMNPELSNVILRFRSAGVTHVLIMENAAVMSFFFTAQAESQRYRPRYGLSTYNTPSTLASQAPASQLEGAVGIGWAPPNDVYTAHHPGGNDSYETCMRVAHEAGVTTAHRSQGYYIVPVCDTVMFLRSALERAPELTPAGLRAGVDRLGTAYRSPFTFATQLGPGRYDGVAAAQPFAYDAGCSCFRYSGGIRRIP